MKKWLWAIVIIIITVIAVWVITKSNGKTEENDFKTEAVKKDTVIVKALAMGQIMPRQEISVKSKIAGIVKKRMVEIGELVKKGQPLLEINPNPTPIEYAETKRSMESAELSYNQGKKEFDRDRQLLEKKLISQQDFEIKQKDFEQKKLQFNLAKEKLSLISEGEIVSTGKNIDNIIKSPIDGKILELFVNEGDPIVPLTSYQAGTSLISLADMDDMIFKGTVDEIDIGKINTGKKAKIKIGALPEVDIEGIVTLISPKAKKEGNSTLFEIEISIKNIPDSISLRAGLSANAEIIINRRDDVIAIPEHYIQYVQDSVYVEVMTDTTSKAIEKKMIQTGLSDGMKTEITEGIEENDILVERPPREIK